jgi:anti-sigma B factor antagonist
MLNPLLQTRVTAVGDTSVIDLTGEISASAEQVMLDAYDQVSAQNTGKVLLDFAQVEYINSTGIALIVRLFSQALKARQIIAVSGLNEHYTEIFKITRLAEYARLYPDRESALQELEPVNQED